MKKSIFILFGLIITQIYAQITPANYLIHSNEIAATMKNDGSMFNSGGSGVNRRASFKVPFKGDTTASSIYNVSLIIGGKDSLDRIFFVGESQTAFKPGPLGNLEELPVEEMINFNKIWSVYSFEISRHIEDYKKDSIIDLKQNNIFSWPAKGNPYFKEYNGFELPDLDLAPFYDIDQDGNYNPANGDYPKVESVSNEIIPSSINWTIFHNSSTTNKNIKFEVALCSWTFNCDNSNLLRTLFCNYKVINRSNEDLNNLIISLYIDPDLGCYEDDYLGSFEELNSVYWYNSDATDGVAGRNICPSNVMTYKGNPPVQSIQYLNKNLYSFVSLDKFFSPAGYYELYNVINGMPKNQPILNPKTGKTTKIMYPGSPSNSEEWSMISELGIKELDMRGYNSILIKDLKIDSFESIDLSYTFHHHPDSNNIQNVNLAKNEIIEIKKLYDERFKEACSEDVCTEDCVWPGDTDNNGIVNYLDVANVFKSVGEKGNKRNDYWEWQAFKSLSWTKNLNSGLNMKYADSDGDGEINSIKDIEVITHNDLKTHGNYKSPIKVCKSGNDFKISSGNDSVFKRPVITVDLTLFPKKKNFQGISFEFNIDSSNSYFLSIGNSKIWKDTAINTLKYSKSFTNSTNNNYYNQSIYFNNKLSNQLALDTINWRIPVLKKTQLGINAKNYFDVELCNALMYFEDGTVDTLGSNKLRLYLTPVGIVDLESESSVEIFPNPTSDKINAISESPIKNIELLNLQGQVLKQVTCNSNNSELDVAFLHSGCYILNIQSRIANIKKRFVKY